MKRLSWEDVRASLGFWPAVAALLSLVLALLVLQVEPDPEGLAARLMWPGDTDSARTVLQVVATAVITVTSLAFSLVVVALQLASQQFSPRLLREFARDWVIQAVLAVLVSTFVVNLTVLRSVDGQRPLPAPAVLLAFLMGLLSVAALLVFLAHLVRALRVDTMMVAVHGETASTLGQLYPAYDDDRPERPGPDLPGPSGGVLVPARRSGFLKVVDVDALVGAAREADVLLRLMLSPGDHLVRGTPVASAWPLGGGQVPDTLADQVAQALEVGFERTLEQDVGLGLRQLTDIAVKALSPSVNDPTTAVHSIGYSADLLSRLCGRRLGEQLHRDERGTPRLVLRDRDFRYYVGIASDQVRRYAAHEPTALIALLRMLRATAVAARDDEQRAAVLDTADRVLAEAGEGLSGHDHAQVQDMHDRVRLALAGDVERAFLDAAGETRSA